MVSAKVKNVEIYDGINSGCLQPELTVLQPELLKKLDSSYLNL